MWLRGHIKSQHSADMQNGSPHVHFLSALPTLACQLLTVLTLKWWNFHLILEKGSHLCGVYFNICQPRIMKRKINFSFNHGAMPLCGFSGMLAYIRPTESKVFSEAPSRGQKKVLFHVGYITMLPNWLLHWFMCFTFWFIVYGKRSNVLLWDEFIFFILEWKSWTKKGKVEATALHTSLMNVTMGSWDFRARRGLVRQMEWNGLKEYQSRRALKIHFSAYKNNYFFEL